MHANKGWLTTGHQDNFPRISLLHSVSLLLYYQVEIPVWPLWCKGDWRKGICRAHRCDTQMAHTRAAHRWDTRGTGDGNGGALCATVRVCGKGVIEGLWALHSWYKGGHLGTLVMLLFASITIHKLHTLLNTTHNDGLCSYCKGRHRYSDLH